MEGVDYSRTVAVVDDYMLQEYAIFALDMDKEEDCRILKAYMDKRLSSKKILQVETRAQVKERSPEVEAVLAELQEDQPTTTTLKVSREPKEVEQFEVDKGFRLRVKVESW